MSNALSISDRLCGFVVLCGTQFDYAETKLQKHLETPTLNTQELGQVIGEMAALTYSALQAVVFIEQSSDLASIFNEKMTGEDSGIGIGLVFNSIEQHLKRQFKKEKTMDDIVTTMQHDFGIEPTPALKKSIQKSLNVFLTTVEDLFIEHEDYIPGELLAEPSGNDADSTGIAPARKFYLQ